MDATGQERPPWSMQLGLTGELSLVAGVAGGIPEGL
jgi:hypothetical protein